MRCLRQILGVTQLDRLRNKTVRRQCDDQSTIKEAIQKRHLQWFGHVSRTDSTRLQYKLLWRRQPPTWKVHRCALKKAWAKQDHLKIIVSHSWMPRPYPPIAQHGNKLWKMLEVRWHLQRCMSYEDVVGTMPAKDQERRDNR